MDGGDRCVPVGFVFDEVVPELAGGEFGGDDDGAAGEERCEETGLQSVDMEERHDEVGPVLGRELVRRDNVICDCHHHVSLEQNTELLKLTAGAGGAIRIVLVRFLCVKGTAFGFPVVPLVCKTRAISSGSANARSTADFPCSPPFSFSTNNTSFLRGHHLASATAALNLLAALTAGAPAAKAPSGTITSALLMSSM